MSDRVKSTDSIATTPPIKKNPPPLYPHSTPTFEASEVESKGLKIAELVEKLGKTRQAIESARDKGTLSESGYRAEKNGRGWFYYPVKKDLTTIDGDNDPR